MTKIGSEISRLSAIRLDLLDNARASQNLNNDKSENVYHHIGIYIYKVTALQKFVSLKQSPDEISLKLEQLRALDNNIKIDVVFANSIPVGVDTNEDFLEIKKLMEYKS